MTYTSDRNYERRPSIEFSEAGMRWASTDPNATYLKRVIEYEFGTDIVSNNTAPAVQPNTVYEHPVQIFEQPTQIYDQPVIGESQVVPAGESDALMKAQRAVEVALQVQEGENGN